LVINILKFLRKKSFFEFLKLGLLFRRGAGGERLSSSRLFVILYIHLGVAKRFNHRYLREVDKLKAYLLAKKP
jgi:hypothetical protein